jgi:hypothetical protein
MRTNRLAFLALAMIFMAFAVYDCLPVYSEDCVEGARDCGHQENHDWYMKLQLPYGPGNRSCCSGTAREGDCRPVRAELREDGHWWAYYKGSPFPGNAVTYPLRWDWYRIPDEKILPDQDNKAPLHSHICEQNGYVYCFLKGRAGG